MQRGTYKTHRARFWRVKEEKEVTFQGSMQKNCCTKTSQTFLILQYDTDYFEIARCVCEDTQNSTEKCPKRMFVCRTDAFVARFAPWDNMYSLRKYPIVPLLYNLSTNDLFLQQFQMWLFFVHDLSLYTTKKVWKFGEHLTVQPSSLLFLLV